MAELFPSFAGTRPDPFSGQARPRSGSRPGVVGASSVATDEAEGADRVVAATDGSSLGNPGPGGWAWYISDQRWGAGGEQAASNNRMELMAVAQLLEATDPAVPLLVLSDSQYTIDALTKWLPGWRKRAFRTAAGKPVANRELIEAIDAALTGREVTFRWVRAHVGHPMNEAADKRAHGAATAIRSGRPPVTGP